MCKNIFDYTKEEFLAMENFLPKKPFNGIIIVPTNQYHDSGYRCMKFVLIDQEEIVGIVSGWSDVLHFCGYKSDGCQFVPSLLLYRWNVDCLPESGCVRFFSNAECICDDFVGSDFNVYPAQQRRENGGE